MLESLGIGQVMVEIRSRSKSVQVVRSPELCLLERLAQLGPGARAADRKKKGGAEVGGSKKKAGIAPCPQK